MKSVMNITTSLHDMDRFAYGEDINNFYQQFDLDGVELMFTGKNVTIPEKLNNSKIVGVHLSFFPNWMEQWKHRDDIDYDKEVQCTPTVNEMLDLLTMELNKAEELGVEYVVYHVSQITNEETFTYNFHNTDEEVIKYSVEMINTLLDEKDYSFYFLCENLWWSGLTLTRPEIVKSLMDGIHYKKKGIMIDTGHLMHTNRSLRTQEEGIDYINEILDRNKEFLHYMKGIHLNYTLSGEYVEDILNNPPELSSDEQQRFIQTMMHVYQIDTHHPFTTTKIGKIIKKINPLYLNHELITSDLEQHTECLKLQTCAIQGGKQ